MAGLRFIIFGRKNDVIDAFITSDNPCFIHINNLQRNNKNAIYFPLCPGFLLVACKGEGSVESVEYREVDRQEMRTYNRIIANNASKYIVSNKRRILM